MDYETSGKCHPRDPVVGKSPAGARYCWYGGGSPLPDATLLGPGIFRTFHNPSFMYIDDISQTVTVTAGTRWSDLEIYVGECGFTTGLQPPPETPPSITVGRMILAGTPNLLWMRYGHLREACVSLEWRWRGATIITHNAPRAATGPDLKGLFIGSAGRMGRLVRITLRLWGIGRDRAMLSGTVADLLAARRFGLSLWSEDLRPVYCGVWEQRGAPAFVVIHHAPHSLLLELVRHTRELAGFYGGQREGMKTSRESSATLRRFFDDRLRLKKAVIDPLNLLEPDDRPPVGGLPKKIARRLMEVLR